MTRSEILSLMEMQKKELSAYRSRLESVLERKGVEDTRGKLVSELSSMENKINNVKENIKKFKEQREEALQTVCLSIEDAITCGLCQGKASLKIENGKVFIGWVMDGTYRPLEGLSGGERVEFLQALETVISNLEAKFRLQFLELAESGETAVDILKHLAEFNSSNIQTIACTWQDIRDFNEDIRWTVISL